MFPIKHLFNPYGTSVDETHRARCMFPRVMHETGSNAKTPKLLIVQKKKEKVKSQLFCTDGCQKRTHHSRCFDYNAVHGSDEMLFTRKLQQDNEWEETWKHLEKGNVASERLHTCQSSAGERKKIIIKNKRVALWVWQAFIKHADVYRSSRLQDAGLLELTKPIKSVTLLRWFYTFLLPFVWGWELARMILLSSAHYSSFLTLHHPVFSWTSPL